MSVLYFIATPIGNLEDLTFRAKRILSEVDFVVAEDKRVTKKILDHFKISTPLLIWHQHSKDADWNKINKLLSTDKDLAIVTDAGTPGLSDPGGKLIENVLNFFPETNIVPVPGPSSLTAIISVAGIQLDKFLFLGFLPHKKGRQTLIEEIKNSKRPVIFLESVHRIEKALRQLEDCNKQLIIGRELTKQFETIYRGTATEILQILNNNKDQVKGEFIIIVGT